MDVSRRRHRCGRAEGSGRDGHGRRGELISDYCVRSIKALLLQDPHAMGSFEPPQRPAIDVIYELFFATLYAPKRSEAARELHGCTHNVLVLKLFWGRTIPPAVDLLDGIASTAVRCSSGPVQVAIMDILMRLPGGLPQVQKAVAQVFQELNQHEYHDWQQLRYAAGHGDTGKMGALLDSGCYPYALQPIGGELPPLAIACMAYARGGKVKKQAIRMLLNAGAAPLSGFNHVKFGELQADERLARPAAGRAACREAPRSQARAVALASRQARARGRGQARGGRGQVQGARRRVGGALR